jgi:excisionase family DNA binding protein
MTVEISIVCDHCAAVIARGRFTIEESAHVREIGGRCSLADGTHLSAQRGSDHRSDQKRRPTHDKATAGVSGHTVEQVAEMLNIGRDKVYYLLRTGQLRSLKIGKLRRITNTQLAEFVASVEQPRR